MTKIFIKRAAAELAELIRTKRLLISTFVLTDYAFSTVEVLHEIRIKIAYIP